MADQQNSPGQDLGEFGGYLAILAGAGGDGGMDQYRAAVQVFKKLQEPDFDMSSLTPAELQLVGQYFPEESAAIIEQKQAQQVADTPEMRQAQLEALAGWGQVAQEGLPLVDRLRAEELYRGMGNEAQANDQAILEDLAARGRLSGGMALQGRLQGSQAAMENARASGSDLAMQAQQARLQGLAQYGNMAGAIRSQDIGLRTTNADAVNRFNEWVSQLKTQVGMQNAQARQAARDRNVSERQRIADYNATNAQDVQQFNLENQNRLRQLTFEDQLAKAQGLSGAYMGYGRAKDAETAGRQSQILGLGRAGGGLMGFAMQQGAGSGAPYKKEG